MFSFGLALLVSLLVSLGVLRAVRWHARYTLDHIGDEARKLHAHAVPRIGGLGVFIAVTLGAAGIWVKDRNVGAQALLLIACSSIAFLGGLTEDLTRRVAPRWRMVLMAATCVLGWWLLDVRIVRIDIPAIDTLFAFQPFAIGLTLLALLTITNAINLIDGLNGLAGVVCAVMFAGLGLVGLKVGDSFVVSCSLLMAGSICGFLFWNYPHGRIFLGDGGAYFLGFMLGAMSILLVARNAQVSAWFPVLLLAYPLFEVAFSIWRRKFVKGAHPGMPDAAHLHHLIYRRVVRWAIGTTVPERRTWRNAMTSPYLWVLSSLAVGPAVVFYDNGPMLMGFSVLFVASYLWLYARIVHMRVPRWLVLKDKRRDD
ncbi:MAG TPA: glycosyltransferase [Burkholderiaceae bacterium]|nr:glycosyltransferase [Burkholderiaceae bacterium]